MSRPVSREGGFRTEAEKLVGRDLANVFSSSRDDLETKLENFPKYIRRQKVTRFIALYELFKKAVNVKGSLVECGVYSGFGLMTWANLSAVLEPNNLTRRIYGFDTFEGFPNVSHRDDSVRNKPRVGDLYADAYEELLELTRIYDSNRFLGHIQKVFLIKGDVLETIPRFIQEHQHLVVSLLFLDLDLYEPTKIAIESFLPRMPKGAVIAFDEPDNPIWPGETNALLDTLGINNLQIERFGFDPYIGYAIIE